MIKVNLLQSVTDRSAGVSFVEEKVSSTRTQTLLIGMIVMGLLVLGMGYDYINANGQHQAAVTELEKQRRINDQMNQVKKEQADLEKKINDIKNRIDAIQKLRASQQGPGAVLREITDRFNSIPGLYLKSVEQKDADVTIKGESPNEKAVTDFGKSLEFSSGLFGNLNIETAREAPGKDTSGKETKPSDSGGPEVVAFTIKCSYGHNNLQASPSPSPKPGGNQVAKNN